MKLCRLLNGIGLLIACSMLYAAEKPHFSATLSEVVTAEVTAVDHDTRAVTLRGEDGEFSFIAGEEVRNLDQVNVGDIVVAEYLENITIQVAAGDQVEVAKAEVLSVARASQGEMPGAEIIDTQVEVAKVVDINLEANTFKLQDADGVVDEYTAQNPAHLQAAGVGDVVVIAITHALAVSVEQVTNDR